MFQLQLFFLLHCDEWDRVAALLRHKFVTGATLLQLVIPERLGISDFFRKFLMGLCKFWKFLMRFCALLEVSHGFFCIYGSSSWDFVHYQASTLTFVRLSGTSEN
jgi:hypothetical protein